MKQFFGVVFAAVCILQILKANESDSSNDRPKLTDLPLEILLDIYEDFDTSTLANVARTHPHNLNAADYVFRNKFAMQTFDINGEKLMNANGTFEFEGILNSLETFARHITKLKLDFRCFTEEQIQKINEHLVKHTADTLVDIELKGCNDTLLKLLTGPFENIEVVRLAGGNMSSNDINWNRIFPKMRSLDLFLMNYYTPESIGHHFPHLTELKVREATCEAAFRLNPQLISIEVLMITWEDFRMLSEILPNLERFTYIGGDSNSRFEGDVIHYENLKAFISKAYFGFFGFPRELEGGPIIFGNLEEMACDIIGGNDWYVEIIQNSNLKKLRSGELKIDQYAQVLYTLTKLEELIVEYDFGITDTVYSIIELVQGNVQLKKVGFCAGFPTMTPEETKQKISDQLTGWNLNRTEECFFFTRE